jgi:hypothetical protein
VHFQDYQIELIRGRNAERDHWERTLAEAGLQLPLPQRSAWAGLQPGQDSWLLILRDREGRCCGGAGLQVTRSRALPGHLLLRCERFGPGLSAVAQQAILHGLAGLARRNPRVLRAYVETYSPDPEQRSEVARVARELGFSQRQPSRCYEQTLLLDLKPDEDTILAGLHKTARRNLRDATKFPVEVRPITNAADFGRMNEIYQETYARTGATQEPQDWAALVDLCKREPAASRLVGLYRTDQQGPEALLAFAWGCGHGDHIHYSKAASTRNTDLRVSLMYPLMWDLIRWGKSNGAGYIDFGGVTQGSLDSQDRLGGISDFKRYFSRQVVEVGAEWAYEPRALQTHAANAMSSASDWLSRLAARVA